MGEEFPFVDAALNPLGLGFRQVEARAKAYDDVYPDWTDHSYRDPETGPKTPQEPPPHPKLMLYPRATHLCLYGPVDEVLEAWVRHLSEAGAMAPGLPHVWEVQAHTLWGQPGDWKRRERVQLTARVDNHWVSVGPYTYWGHLRKRPTLDVIEHRAKPHMLPKDPLRQLLHQEAP